MLERAAGCLENAGRRFFRDSNGAIRSPRSLYSNIAQSNGTGVDSSQRLASVHPTSQRASVPLSGNSSTERTRDDARTPILDFLYPSRTQELISSCLLRSPRRFSPRRRKRAVPNLTRAYTSEAADLRLAAVERPIPGISGGESNQNHAKQKLLAILDDKELASYDTAWELYMTAGYPEDVNSALLARLSHSRHAADHRHIQRLFDGISPGSRSSDDYLHMAKSYLAVGKESEVIEMCHQAVPQGTGMPCWALSIAHFVNTSQWEAATALWSIRPVAAEYDLRQFVASHTDSSRASKGLLSLATFLQERVTHGATRGFAHFLLQTVFATREAVYNTSTETLLQIVREYNALSILVPEHYFRLIKTLQSSKERMTFARSLIMYRNFRWLMDGEVPPEKLLTLLVRKLTRFHITAGMRYLLDDLTYFYGKPTIDAYRYALLAFSRAGDVATVYEIFEDFLSDHGKPLSRKLVTPLLYVHASVGNVEETKRQFDRISGEFDMTPNTVCWNILLTAYANSDETNGIFATFKKMLENDIEPSSHSFGILMGQCANRGDIDTVRQLLALAKKRQVVIATSMLDTIVEVYCNNQKLDLAENLAEICLGMHVKGPRLRMWNILLWNYAFRIDLESISRIRSRMDAAGLQPDAMTYAALMLSLVLVGQTDSARRILRTLHRSRRIYATEFHYAIILYGYVKERNRDMVHIIFQEIKERFQRPGISSNLLALKSTLQRDLQLQSDGGRRAMNSANVRLENAERLLSEIIADFDITQMATKKPIPGAGKQAVGKAFPSMYYEYMITAYGRRGAFDRARELFDQYTRTQTSPAPENAYNIAPLRLLSALMLAHLKAENYKEVEECWKMAFPRAKKLARPPAIDKWLSNQMRSAATIDLPRSSLSISIDEKDILLRTEATGSLGPKRNSPILPAYRFMLSRPLSSYMRSLAYRNEASKIHKVVAEVKQAGFALTTYNWSTFVQMLASSDKPSDQIQAFSIFEEKFMPNFPGWRYLRRGYGLRPPGVPSTIDVLEPLKRGKHPNLLGKEGRRYWSKIDPGFMQPTYVSMVYLASALLGIRERSIVDGGAEVKSLYRVAPRTVDAVADMPYMREKFQGVLLRRRQEQGDKKPYLDQLGPYVWTGGILGVGGQPRGLTAQDVPAQPEDQPDTQDTQPEGLLSDAGVDSDLPLDNTLEPSENTLDPQDAHDLEIETLLESRRGSFDMHDELLDNDNYVDPDRDYDTLLLAASDEALFDVGDETSEQRDVRKQEVESFNEEDIARRDDDERS